MADQGCDSTHRLADHALSIRYEDLPVEVVERTKLLLLDFLGVACGGRALADSSGPMLGAVRELCGGRGGAATVVGEEDLFPTHYAALLNGTFGHSLDFDDTHVGSDAHVATPVFSTLLALGEAGRLSGREFLAAAVAGYEVAGRVGKAAAWGIHRRGFHPTATTTIFGATAAGARLLGLSRETLLEGWGINLSQAAGTHQYMANGAWTKRIQVGMVGHNALLALAMARHGIRGAADPFEGQYGYYRCFAEGSADLGSALEGLGEQYEVLRSAVKVWPCCSGSFAAIDGVLALAQEHALGPDDVAGMEIGLQSVILRNVGQPESHKRNPRNLVEGQFSLFFTVAAALLDGGLTLESYRRLGDPQVRELMDRIRAVETNSIPVVAITTRNGEKLVKEVPTVKGDPEDFLTREELLAKVLPLCRAALPPAAPEAMVETVLNLEEVHDLGDLTRHLRGGFR